MSDTTDSVVHIVAHIHPFAPSERIRRDILPGRSLEEIVAETVPHRVGRPVVQVDGETILREAWKEARPAGGALVTIRVLPAGSNEEIDRGQQKGAGWSFLTAVVGFVLMFTPLAPLGAWMFGAGIVGLGAVGLVELAQQGFMSAGAAGVTPENLPSIRGARNQARPWGKIPVIIGKHLITPPYAARPFTEIGGADGEDMYLRMLFCVG
ncbi:MAG: hypothetical protein JNG85_13220, partial [Spirochaetaceae bacterium]|nr:hypothetical protein [Spirochaetaceae bacterium]